MSDIENIYFFERCFPANYGLPFRPPIKPFPGKIDCTKEELEKQPVVNNKGFRALVDCSDFEKNEVCVITCNQDIKVAGRQIIPVTYTDEGNPIIPDVAPREMEKHFKLPDYYDSADVASSLAENKILEVKAAPAEAWKMRI